MTRLPLLTGRLVRLRAPRLADLDRLLETDQDPDVMRMGQGGLLYPFTEKRIREGMETPNVDGRVRFVIAALDDDRCLGQVALTGVSLPHRVANLGISIHPDAQGRGIGRDAMEVVLTWAFDQANLHKVHLGTWSDNERAQGLYRSLGFTEEGRVRDFAFRDGAYHDDVAFGMLAREWRQPNSEDPRDEDPTPPEDAA